MKNAKSRMCFAALGWLAASCGSVQDVKHDSDCTRTATTSVRANGVEEDGDGDEEAIDLAQVPEAVKQAALAAVPGLVLETAERESERGSLLYSLEGRAGGERVEVEVRAGDAKVTEVERGDDEDED